MNEECRTRGFGEFLLAIRSRFGSGRGARAVSSGPVYPTPSHLRIQSFLSSQEGSGEGAWDSTEKKPS